MQNKMNRLKVNFRFNQATAVALALTVGLAAALSTALPALADSPATNAVPPAASAKKPERVKRQVSGAELYSMHCNRCHPERYPTERTAAQWKTIVLHMQVRANLPPAQARMILKYLQENSGR